MRRRVGIIGLTMLALASTGCADEDRVTGPFFTAYDLEPEPCSTGTGSDIECYRLVTQVSEHPGIETGECRVFALADDFATDLGEAARFGRISIRAGDSPAFSVALPVAKPDRFLRWQVDCQPGPPG